MTFKINTTLHTTDGRIIGNAIITDHHEGRNIIKTDYGNISILSDEEVLGLFYIGLIALEDHKNFNHDFSNPKVQCQYCDKMHTQDGDCLPF